jgi:type I restriction-modification system DNA methylase subunit
MTNKTKEKEQVVHLEEISEVIVPDNASLCKKADDLSEEDMDGLFPPMNVAGPSQQASDAALLIPDSQYLGLLDEISSNIREDRKQVSDYIDNMADMVINDGDTTTSTKEALVNLVKIKSDLQDKMLKVADLMTRLKLKNTYAYSGAHMNAMQQNNINIGADAPDFSRRELIRAINHAKKKKDQ